jgi:Uma2 family endonuclease
MGSGLHYLPLPLTITLSAEVPDSDFQVFCASNEPFPTDHDASGRIIVEPPAGEMPEMDWGSYLHYLPRPFTIVTAAPVTDLELIRFSRENKHLRIEKNTRRELVVMDTIGWSGSQRRNAVFIPLYDWAQQDGRGKVHGGNCGWNLADGSTLAPDVSWTSNERLSKFTKKEHEGFLPIAPDFVVEILADGDPLAERQAKMLQWLENGAQLGWLIDPFQQTAAIYRAGEPPRVLEKPDVLDGDRPIAGFTLEMGWLRRQLSPE